MTAAFTRRRILILSAVLLAGAALFIVLRQPANEPGSATGTGPQKPPASAASAPPVRHAPSAFVPPISLADAPKLSTAEIALQLAGWPEGRIHPDLPKWAALLAARGTEAIKDISSALATAESDTGRGVLSDALARIGTDDAVQELCEQAVKAPEEASRQAIASSFRALSRPAAVPMLASVLSEADSTPLVAEASDAIRRLADRAGVEVLADYAQEGGQLYSQRDNIFRILSTLENPDALPALQTLAADGTDRHRAEAARAGIIRLKRKMQE